MAGNARVEISLASCTCFTRRKEPGGAVIVGASGRHCRRAGAVIAMLVLLAAIPAVAFDYTITDVGVLPGSTTSLANGMNAAGEIVGEESWATGHGFLWQNGVMTDLGTVGDWWYSRARDINDSGQIVGELSYKGGSGTIPKHAFLWQSGTMTDLTGISSYSTANAINNAGQLVGSAKLFSIPDYGYAHHAFMYREGDGLTDLGVLYYHPNFYNASEAFAINNLSQVVGRSGTQYTPDYYPVYHAFLWEAGTMRDLGTLGGVNQESAAMGINDQAEIVGYSETGTGSERAFFWQKGILSDLGTLGGDDSAAYAINDTGWIVGSAEVAGGGSHACLVVGGVMFDLNALIPPGSGWTALGSARAINNAGQICGNGSIGGETHGFLLTPNSDTEVPTVTGCLPANGATITTTNTYVDVTFSEPVTYVEETDMVLAGTAAVYAGVAAPIRLTDDTWRFPILRLCSGTLNISLAPEAGDIMDLGGNDLTPANWSYSVTAFGMTTVLAEDFESVFVSGAPPNWTKSFKAGYFDWVQNAGDSTGGSAHGDSYNAMLYYSSAGVRETYLISPAIDFGAGAGEAVLEFWHQQVPTETAQDTLKVYYKTSAGGAWTQLASYASEANSWTRRMIALPDAGSTYYIGFLGSARSGNGVCIDDVVVTREVSGPAPVVTSITPGSGLNTGAVDVTDLTGTGFQEGAVVRLSRAGEADINATSVTVVSTTQITCTFDLVGAVVGEWDVVVTNPDTQSASLANGFVIANPPPTVTSITPDAVPSDAIVNITNLAGTGFLAGASVKLVRSGEADIIATEVVVDTTRITCAFDLTDAAIGSWDVVVTNFDAQSATLTDGFSVTNPLVTVTIGSGTSTMGVPMGTGSHDERTQVIYRASEIGGIATIAGLALDVATVPGQEMTNWTIRMKHTSSSYFYSASWETGWTVVYQANEPRGAAGWREFYFPVPFSYNGVSNLMVDFSFNNSSSSTSGTCRYSTPGSNRTMYFATNSGYGDPLTWSGTTPSASLITNVPNARLLMTAIPFKVSSITPSYGYNNGSIDITNLAGNGFLAGATAKLTKTGQPDIEATNLVVVSPTQITCSFDLSGAATGSWNVVVTNPDAQSATRTNGFTVNNPLPTVISIAPDSGANNGTVAITELAGTGFLPGAIVRLTRSGQPTINATDVTVVDPTQITCTFDLAGAALGAWNVVVTNTDSQWGSLTNGFMVVNPPPVITSITPDAGLNTGSVEVTDLAGTGFQAGATVRLTRSGQPDIVASDVTVVSEAQITCTFDLAGAAAGAWSVVVTNSDAQTGTLTDGFTVQNPAPTVTSITPNSSPPTGTVSITDLAGTGFMPGASVALRQAGQADIDAADVVVVSSTQITCSFTLEGAATGFWDVVVTNTDAQTATLAGGFGVNPPPTVTGITPATGCIGGTVSVTDLAGTGFLPGAAVKLTRAGQADIDATNVTVVDPTRITCTFNLTGAEIGVWDVVVTNPDAQFAILSSGFSVIEVPDTITIGTGTSTSYWPMATYYHDARTQIIYLASEIGVGATIRGIALDVATIPGQTMYNWTIRMKHTPLSAYATASWESDWTVVYQAMEPRGTTGWRMFYFTTPFDYDGLSNLMVDFSFNNTSYTSDGKCRYSVPGGNRTIYYRTDSGFGDPLAWSGTSSPSPTLSTIVPNVQLVFAPLPLEVTGITPAAGYTTTNVNVTNLAGNGFQAGATAKLRRAGQSDIEASNLTVVTVTKITCTFDLSDAEPGFWDVVVTNPNDETVVLPGGFSVDELPPPPEAPTMNAEPAYTSSTYNTVSWSGVTGAEQYYVEWDTDGSFVAPVGGSGWIMSTSYTAGGLGDGQTYFYHVQARNIGGQSDWSNVVFSQQCTAPWIVSNPGGRQVQEGSSTTFVVTAGGTPPLAYQWRKDGMDIDGAIGASYTINNVALADAGVYDVHITNTCGSVTSSPATLTVVVGVPADLDGDTDVDLADFSAFAQCFNGPNRAPAGGCAAAADLDTDGDVDLADFSVFAQCFNGPNRAPAAGCPSP
ncbi:MAG: choice-of-anchor J domain-containing protein [Phycisphaerae bacterium]|nr:choice-of-anchor J domain-containing protein [Phycisphaerae bacterium]